MKHKLGHQRIWVTGGAVSAMLTALVATGCGGGSTNAEDTPAAPIILTGKVIANLGIQGATVCLDLNANQQCDPGEPVSQITGADGAYSLTTDPAKTTAEQVAAAPFAALLPATAIDAAEPGSAIATQAMVFMAPAGKGSQINPLTTLVQTGVTSGLALADAEAAVAVQMGVSAADIYDYQSQSAPVEAPFADNARVMASVVLHALANGQRLDVVGLSANQADDSALRQLNHTDANNYYVRSLHDADEAGTGKRLTTDQRRGLTNGTAIADAQLYQTAYLTPTGWVQCGKTTPIHSTRGTPNRSSYCGGGQSTAGYHVSTDVSGQNMGEVIRQIQADTNASHGLNLNAALVDNATFPAGSAIMQRRNLELGQNIYVNNLNSPNEVLTGAINASLETFVQGRQNAQVDLSKNFGLVWLGFTGDANHWLAGAFLDSTSKVQYYSCTVKTTNGVQGYDVCSPAAQGSFGIVTQGGKRLIKFAGQPNPVDSVSFTVGYAEYAPGVMVRFRETRADERYVATANNRLNATAGNALLTTLGLGEL